MRHLPLVALALALAQAPPAVAHAILMSSTPAAGSTLPPGPVRFVLHYNSRIDQARSRLELRGSPGATPLKLLPAPDDALEADTTLAPGAWVIRWQVLAVDGHITRGDVPVTVQAN